MQRHFGIAQTTAGQAVPSATVTVNLAGTANLATLYSDNAYTPLANPFTSEVDGAYQFYARNGRYDIVLTKTNYTFDDDDTANTLLYDPSSVISPAQIIANQNDYSPTNALGASIWRINSDATRTITGIGAGYAQQIITLVNIGAQRIILANQSASSSAANRVIVPSGTDLIIDADENVTLVYDLTSTRWRAVVNPISVPDVEVLSRSATNVSFSNTGALQTLHTFTVPANTLGTTNVLRITALGRIQNTAGVGSAFGIGVSYGGTAIITNNATLHINNGSDAAWQAEAYVAGNNATNAQKLYVVRSVDGGAVAGALNPTTARGSAAIDSTANQTLLVTSQMTADPAIIVTLEYVTVERLR